MPGAPLFLTEQSNQTKFGEESLLATGEESLLATGEESLWATGEDSLWATGEESLWATCEESLLATGEESLLATGEESLLATGEESLWATGEESLLATGEESLLATGEESLLATGEESPLATGEDSLLATVLGFMPLSYQLVKDRNKNMYLYWSLRNVFYSTAISVCLMSSNVIARQLVKPIADNFDSVTPIGVHQPGSNISTEDGDMTEPFIKGGQALTILNTYISSSVVVSVILLSCLKFRRLPEILCRIRRFDDTYLRLLSDPDEITTLHRKCHLFCVSCVIGSCLISVGSSAASLYAIFLKQITYPYILIDIAKLGIFLLEIQFMSLCFCLQQRFLQINKALIRLRKHTIEGQVDRIPIGSEKFNIPAVPSTKTRSLQAQGRAGPRPVEQLCSLRHSHLHLSDLVQALNSTYQTQLLLIMAESSCALVINMYFSYYVTSFFPQAMASGILWASNVFTKITCVCVMAQRTVKEVSLTNCSYRLSCSKQGSLAPNKVSLTNCPYRLSCSKQGESHELFLQALLLQTRCLSRTVPTGSLGANKVSLTNCSYRLSCSKQGVSHELFLQALLGHKSQVVLQRFSRPDLDIATKQEFLSRHVVLCGRYTWEGPLLNGAMLYANKCYTRSASQGVSLRAFQEQSTQDLLNAAVS
uniref:Gustatory receptor n=1 Tax=Timema shepardi TaxID=629360 RepID=A0A7R9G2E0_TIMSH|nr:unnamed protein product [Timema shepardi]